MSMKRFTATLWCVGVIGVTVCASGLARAADAASVSSESSYKALQSNPSAVGLLPSSPFYFLKEWRRQLTGFFTFNSMKRIELELRYSAQKTAEIEAVHEHMVWNTDAMVKALASYHDTLARLEREVGDARENGAALPRDITKALASAWLAQRGRFVELSYEYAGRDNASYAFDAIQDELRGDLALTAMAQGEWTAFEEELRAFFDARPPRVRGELMNVEMLDAIKERVTDAALIERMTAIRQELIDSFAQFLDDLDARGELPQALHKAFEDDSAAHTRFEAILKEIRSLVDVHVWEIIDALGYAPKGQSSDAKSPLGGGSSGGVDTEHSSSSRMAPPALQGDRFD